MTTPPLAYNEFPIGAVLTITAGNAERIFCNYADQCRILGFMCGQFPGPADVQAYIDAARPAVITQHPGLANVTPPDEGLPDTVVLGWINQQAETFGATMILEAL